MRGFDHERLDVYQVALDFVALAEAAIGDLARGRAHPAQLATGRELLLRLVAMLTRLARRPDESARRAKGATRGAA